MLPSSLIRTQAWSSRGDPLRSLPSLTRDFAALGVVRIHVRGFIDTDSGPSDTGRGDEPLKKYHSLFAILSLSYCCETDLVAAA